VGPDIIAVFQSCARLQELYDSWKIIDSGYSKSYQPIGSRI